MIRFVRTSFEDQRLNDQMQAIQDSLDEMQLSPIEGDLVVDSLVGSNTEDAPYTAESSFQVVGPDLNVSAGVGKTGDTAFLASIMGNLLGDSLTKTGNYLGGVIGAYSVTGTKASVFPTGALIGVLMDGVTQVDGIVVADLDGDDPSSITTATAAFKVRQCNNHASSKCLYGLDLFDDAASLSGYYSGTAKPFAPANADIRMADGRVWMSGSGAPSDGTTGDNFAGTGSLYTRTSNGELYIQVGAITNPTWKIVTHA